MANEIKASDTNIHAASVLSRELYRTIEDHFDIRPTCLRVQPNGSLSTLIPHASFDDTASAPGEATATTPTALGTAQKTVTSARITLMYADTDESAVAGSRVSVQDLIDGLTYGYLRYIRDTVCDIIDGFTDTAGSTGVAITLDTIFDAQFELIKNKVRGVNPACLISYKQYTDFQRSLRGAGGAVQFMPATAEQLRIKGQGYQGNWNGLDISITDVKNDGTDDIGAMYYPGAVAIKEETVEMIRPRLGGNEWIAVAPAGSTAWVEKIRVGGSGITQWMIVFFFGAAMNEDAKGVSITGVD